MLWPGQFANTSLFYALHDKTPSDPEQTNGWGISRYRYFMYVTIGSFVWYWYVASSTSGYMGAKSIGFPG